MMGYPAALRPYTKTFRDVSKRKGRLVRSALVRVIGAVLVAVGLAVGMRVLGPAQFGMSVLVLSVGQLVAFPLTAMERLVIRLVSQRHNSAARDVISRANRICLGVTALSALLAGVLYVSGRQSQALFVLASGVTAVSAGVVTIRQGESRAAGRLGWGQVPNELFRPIATIVAFPAAVTLEPSNSGAVATLMASAATLAVMMFAPSVEPSGGQRSRSGLGLGSAATSLMIVSVVALAVERLYPVVLGWTGPAAEVAIFAVVMRVTQLANFSQAFAIFFYSPSIAVHVSADGLDASEIRRLARRVRVVGLASALPVAALCLVAPAVIEAAVGQSLPLDVVLRITALSIAAMAFGGPSQTVLIMAGREQMVARAYLWATLASVVAFAIAGMHGALAATIGLVAAFLTWNALQVLGARRSFGFWI